MGRVGVFLLICILLSSMLIAPARGDGVPLIPENVIMRENLQLAHIDVGNDSESLHLFLSVVSLDPGEDMTILIPLRTHPETLNIDGKYEYEFEKEHDFPGIDGSIERQNRAGEHLKDTMNDMFPYFLASETAGTMGFFTIFLYKGIGTLSGSSVEHYSAEGISVDVISFNSSDSMADFYASLGVDVPEDIQEVIERYGNYSVAAVNCRTEPPIEEYMWEELNSKVPWAIDEFRDYVKNHSYLTVYRDFYGFKDAYLEGIEERIQDDSDLNIDEKWRLSDYFTKLVLSTYGIGTMKGFEISMNLPLYSGKAFFPLGTSPAWGGITSTKVIFSIDDSLSLSFNKPMQESFYKGKHYYLWSVDNSVVDYDLEGTVNNSPDTIGHIRADVQEFVYDKSFYISFFIYLSIPSVFFSVIFYFSDYRRKNIKLEYRKIPLLILRSYLWGFGSLLAGVFFIVPHLYEKIYGKKLINYNKKRKEWKRPRVREYSFATFLSLIYIIQLPFIFIGPMSGELKFYIMTGLFFVLWAAASAFLVYKTTQKEPFKTGMTEKEQESIKKEVWACVLFSTWIILIPAIEFILAAAGIYFGIVFILLFMAGIWMPEFMLLYSLNNLGYIYARISKNPQSLSTEENAGS